MNITATRLELFTCEKNLRVKPGHHEAIRKKRVPILTNCFGTKIGR